MKSIIASGLLLIGTLFTAANCLSPDQHSPPSSLMVNYTAGDGIWIAGQDIAPGVWSTNSRWRELPNCVWFVSPSSDPQPDASPSVVPLWTTYRDTSQGSVTFRLHAGEGLTISGCGSPMAWTGD